MTDALVVVQDFYSLLAKAEGTGALLLLHPDIEWTEAERTPYFTGTMRGVDAVVSGLFEPLARDFDNFVTVADEFVVEEERVVAFSNYSGFAKRGCRTMSAPFVHFWTVSNGRLRRFIQYTDSTPWIEALAVGPGE